MMYKQVIMMYKQAIMIFKQDTQGKWLNFENWTQFLNNFIIKIMPNFWQLAATPILKIQ